MATFTVTPLAIRDLDQIWEYSYERWSEAQAETYIRLIHAAISDVAADPRRGTSVDELRAGYRKYAVGTHVLFSGSPVQS